MTLRTLVAAVLLGGGIAVPRGATADIASDHPAAILVFPKLVVDTANGIDTLIRVTNVASTAINVKCFYVNATPQCTMEDATTCFPDRLSCFRTVEGQLLSGMCVPQWQETDFFMRLTREQPTGWLVSGGESVNCGFLNGVCSQDHTTSCNDDGDCGIRNRCIKAPCFPLDGGILGRIGPDGQDNRLSAVPLAPQDPFIGELKCIALDDSDQPVARNDLIGTAVIGRLASGPENAVEVSGYNAIGIPALLDECLPSGKCSISNRTCQNSQQCAATNNRDTTLVLGGPADKAEYDGCPNVLILDHFLDGAADPLVTNTCNPDGTCSVSGTPCANDNNCLDNICLASGSCSVTKTPCAVPADCQNTCVTTNACVGNTCSVTGQACSGTHPCPNNICSLSGEPNCLSDDDCTAPTFQARVVTELTLVPCTEDFESQQTFPTSVQFLVFNEFEQRFSASKSVECFKETRLSNIDTGQNGRSIFTVGAMGTLTGQTRIRGVVNKDINPLFGNALLGVAEEFRCAGPKYDFPLCDFVDQPERLISSAAKNLHFQGRRPQSDFIYLPPQ